MRYLAVITIVGLAIVFGLKAASQPMINLVGIPATAFIDISIVALVSQFMLGCCAEHHSGERDFSKIGKFGCRTVYYFTLTELVLLAIAFLGAIAWAGILWLYHHI
jgi:hypothetical protein